MLWGRNRNSNTTDHDIEVSYVSGADLMIRKDTFEFVGGFDEKYFMYFEETDLCYQIKKKRIGKVICSPKSKIIHLVGQSSSSRGVVNEWKIKTQKESSKHFFLKNHGKVYCNIFNSILLLDIYLRKVRYKYTNKLLYNYWSSIYSIYKN